VVCEATQSQDVQIRVAALQCLVKIMTLYYQYMEAYMAQALFPITLEAMRSENDQVALQGIEFWSNTCDEEIDLAIESQEAKNAGECKGFQRSEILSVLFVCRNCFWLIPRCLICDSRSNA